ncbi:MAG TPA: 2-succinyl-5-enolpyruvyl-6-hydroxy-3-cyclohexene-1-carboxylic-acid synthase [Motiliproteus sp.]
MPEMPEMFPRRHPSLNLLWAALLLEELQRRGVRHCCIAPGSRSTPLLLAALQRRGLQLHQHLDERGLGFLALGIAKASGETVAVITTSGSAVANLYPAVIEAAMSGARLVVLSADRPPRLWDCGANQAIRQAEIFADYPRASLNLDSPNLNQPAADLLAALDSGLDAIQQPAGGVLHINCPFDEPLYPEGEPQDFTAYLQTVAAWCTNEQPWRPVAAPAALALPETDTWQRFAAAPGVIVVGAPTAGQSSAESAASARAIKQLAQRLGWPLLADIQSPLKFDPECLGLGDLLLTDPVQLSLLQPCRHLLQLGGRLVSKRLQQWVDSHPWQQFWMVHPGDYPLAPGRNHSAFFAAPEQGWCRAMAAQLPELLAAPSHTASRLQHANHAWVESLHQRFGRDGGAGEWNELSAAYRLLQCLPPAAPLVVGNSLAIRLLELLGGNLPELAEGAPRLIANRGTSGIEGLVATAAGVALQAAEPVTLLLGDTSLLYDLNGLALLRELPQPLVIVVLNNDGGGIFELLPVPNPELRRDYYQRPHGLHFDAACSLFGLEYQRPAGLAEFERAYQQARQVGGSSLIEVVCDSRTTAAAIRGLTQVHKTG